MNHESKKGTLSKLALVDGEKSQELLVDEYGRLKPTLLESSDYIEIHESLDLLETFVFRVPDVSCSDLITLVSRLNTLEIAIPDNVRSSSLAKYYSNSALQIEAITVLSRLRYLKTTEVLKFLFSVITRNSENYQPNEEVQKSARKELKQLAQFDISVMEKIGFTPQVHLLRYIESMSNVMLQGSIEAVKAIFGQFLSAQVEESTWTAKAVSISSHTILPTDQIEMIRTDSLRILKDLYATQTDISQKAELLGVMQMATQYYVRGEVPDETANMIASNTLDVLEFLRALVGDEELEIVQKIEHDCYWIYYHGWNDEIKSKAQEVEQEISRHDEYQIYRNLIGYDGVFGNWSEAEDNRSKFREIADEREDKAREYADSITEENWIEWRDRIIKFSQCSSNDLAHFPVFFSFLGHLSSCKPHLAMRLVKEHVDEVESILISLIRSLWDTDLQAELLEIMNSWISSGTHLFEMTKMFINNDRLDLDTLVEISSKASEIGDLKALKMLITVVASNYPDNIPKSHRNLFLKPFPTLTQHNNPSWVYEIWYHKETFNLISDLDESELDIILENLLNLREVEYQSERILQPIAERLPMAVVDFFERRLSIQYGDEDGRPDGYWAIPFSLNELKVPLADAVQELVPKLRRSYDESDYLSSDARTRLLMTVFPTFSPEFESELLKILERNTKEDIDFVTMVLCHYNGEPFIHNVCKRVVSLVQGDDDHLGDVRSALRSTGVVSGEYGFVNAYENKVEEIEPWLRDEDEHVREFARGYIEQMRIQIEAERQRADEGIALRKYQYGEKL